ncbi:MAG: SDR family oxidoreductase [Candidatus Pristimantibacillus lignocellulolyticus]|uniref:SDR family oxidoreductase n=1 Tax=Candidatus Pristimantibacillus lignocellulolyticus TaxID=2994561 RepID=A0A9J6ZJ12_9BACL|nr:MAG: SDR family oxidoreductase [Candidatus Pristimantibacillus lignocellulolyticus]
MNYTKKFSLVGKNAIVTGGAGILGRHFCFGLAEAGAQVAVVDINKEASQQVVDQIIERGGKATRFYCNLTSEQSVISMVDSVRSEFGSIDILHNNAAGKSNDLNAFFAPFEEYELNQWNQIMSTDLDSMFLVAKHVGKVMKEQGQGGSIMQTSSIYGIMGPDNRIYEGSYYLERGINTPAIYSAAKAGVIGLTRYLATYWAKDNIRVNTITPGGVESGQNDVFKEKYSNRIPLGRMAQPEEMVGALIFLASDASSYITGQNIIIDGGLNAW